MEEKDIKKTEDTKDEYEEVPLWHRQNLTIEEAVAYMGIGRDTLYRLINQENCDFSLKIGKRSMIKRKRFEDYIEKMSSI